MKAREFNMAVNWFRPSAPEVALGTFLAVRDDSNRTVGVRLIRVRVGEASMSRGDAFDFGQPVPDWEIDAEVFYEGCMDATAMA